MNRYHIKIKVYVSLIEGVDIELVLLFYKDFFSLQGCYLEMILDIPFRVFIKYIRLLVQTDSYGTGERKYGNGKVVRQRHSPTYFVVHRWTSDSLYTRQSQLLEGSGRGMDEEWQGRPILRRSRGRE